MTCRARPAPQRPRRKSGRKPVRLGGEFCPAVADCGYRAPLAPRLARPTEVYRSGTLMATETLRRRGAGRGGGRGIRTLDTLRYTRFPSARTRPAMRSLPRDGQPEDGISAGRTDAHALGRRGWDLNPRGCDTYSFSRRALSTTQTPLRDRRAMARPETGEMIPVRRGAVASVAASLRLSPEGAHGAHARIRRSRLVPLPRGRRKSPPRCGCALEHQGGTTRSRRRPPGGQSRRIRGVRYAPAPSHPHTSRTAPASRKA